MNRRPVVAVDLDGVLSDGETFKFKNGRWDDFLQISKPLPGARTFVEDLSRVADIVIYTSRLDTELHNQLPGTVADAIYKWLSAYGFPQCRVWIGQGKPMAEAYVDDRAVPCVPHADGTQAYRQALQHIDKLIARANKTYQNLGLGELKGGKNHVSVRQTTRKNSRRTKR